jgi:hypothetical protein
MSRGGIQKPKIDLADAIEKYSYSKKQELIFKNMSDTFNTTIKDEFKNRNITEFIAGDIVASITYTPKEDFNELQAIEILRKSLPEEQFSQLVKTREYLDQDAFEKAVYNKQIKAEILAPAVTPKEPTATLRLGKVKK